MIEQLTDFPSNVVAFVCKGRVTKSDYDAVLVPAVLNALERTRKSGLTTKPTRILPASISVRRGNISRSEWTFHALGQSCRRHRHRMDQAHDALFRFSHARDDGEALFAV